MFRRRRAPRAGTAWRVVVTVVAVLAALLAINTIVMSDETKSAKADIGRIIELPGGDLQVREDGPPTGPPIVLIHGWAASMHWWDAVVERLRDRFHLIRVDLLGHGGSEKPRSGYTMENQARQVARALSVLRTEKALVAGHSAGGEVAIALAARYPKLVSRLVVVDTKPDQRYVNTAFLTKLSLQPVIGQAIRRVVTDGQIRDGLEQGFAKGYDFPHQFVRDVRKMTFSSYRKTYERSRDYVESGRLARDYRSIKVSATIVFGAEDRLVDSEAAQQFSKLRPSHVVLVPGAGHSPMVEKPVLVAGLLRQISPRR